jgi:intein-encoded DNA endonuclease-like protein
VRNNATGAENQQGSPLSLFLQRYDPSETTRRAPLSNAEICAYLQGALHDASRNKRTRIRFTQGNREWLEFLQLLLGSLGHKAWLYREGKNRHVWCLETTAQCLDFSCEVTHLSSLNEQKAYIRGFFDAEGGMPRNTASTLYFQLVQNDRPKLERIKQVLDQMNIATGKIHNPSVRLHPEYWRMFVVTRSHRTFMETIGSWHPRKAEEIRKRMMI